MPAKSVSTFFSVLFKTDSDCGLSSGRTSLMYKKTSFTIDFHGLAKDFLCSLNYSKLVEGLHPYVKSLHPFICAELIALSVLISGNVICCRRQIRM